MDVTLLLYSLYSEFQHYTSLMKEWILVVVVDYLLTDPVCISHLTSSACLLVSHASFSITAEAASWLTKYETQLKMQWKRDLIGGNQWQEKT
jgi:hypothetical protein